MRACDPPSSSRTTREGGGWGFRYLNDYIVPYLVTFVVATVLLCRFDRMTGSVFGVFIVSLFGVLWAAPRQCLPHASEHSAAMGQYHERLEELVQNLEAVYTTDQQDAEIGALHRESNGRYFEAFRRTSRCARRYKATFMPLLVGLLLLVMMRCRQLAATGRRTTAQCVSTFLLVSGLLGSMLWVVDIVQADIFDMGHLVQCDLLFGELPEDNDHEDVEPSMADHHPPAPPADGPYALGLVNVCFRYGGGGTHTTTPHVLQDRTLHFERGERTVLMGPVGCGKTTVLRLLLGLHRPQPGAGDAYWEGQWYRAHDVRRIRRAFGYVPQHPVLFDRSVLDNVLYGNHDTPAKREQAEALLHETGLATRLVGGVHAPAGKAGLNLSGGQRQLVWCMRVLLQDPRVLIMDEPTASMDVGTKDLLLGLLDRLMAGRTVVYVSHDPYLIQRATREVRM